MRYGLDLGGSTLDLVQFSSEQNILLGSKTLESSLFLKKDILVLLREFGVLEKIQEQGILFVTGGHSLSLSEVISDDENNAIRLQKTSEFEAIAKGGSFLSGENSGLMVSLGTGTAMVSVIDMEKNIWEHVGGTGLGGGTFLGLSKGLLGISSFEELQHLAAQGDASRVNISVGEIIGGGIGRLTPEMTASNFGKFSENSSSEDRARGIAHLIGESIASLAVEKAKRLGHTKIILGGKFSRLSVVVECIKKTASFFEMEVSVPKSSGFMTAVGGVV